MMSSSGERIVASSIYMVSSPGESIVAASMYNWLGKRRKETELLAAGGGGVQIR